MGISSLLEEFSAFDADPGQRIELSDVALEEQKLQAFERGYAAGWDDAVNAQSDDQKRVSADFAQNLQDLSFTYYDAINRLSTALKPLLTQIVDKVLPRLGRETLGAHVVEQLTDMASSELEQKVNIVTSPENSDALRALLDREIAMPVNVVEEDTLGEGQVFIRFGSSECEVNLDVVLDGISESVNAFFHQVERDAVHE